MTAEHLDKPRILIVEDNPADVDVLIEQLAGAGFTIVVAEDGEDALERSQYKPPDLILLDVILPGIDGFETCRRLKADERTKAIPVIFMTSLTGLTDKIRGFEMGGVDFITKPVQEQEVLARVKTHLALRRMHQQIEAQNAQLQHEIAMRQEVEVGLQRAQAELEQRVETRTLELRQTNEHLIEEIEDRKRAEEEIQRRNRELALLNRVIAASVSETQPEAILEIACRELALIFNLPQAQATLLNEQLTEATVVAEYQTSGRLPMLGRTFQVAGNPALEYLLNQQSPLVAEDAQHDPAMVVVHELLRQRGSVSLLTLPFVVDGATIGALTLSALEPHPFTDDEVGLASSVAKQVAGVLARLRLDQARLRLEAQYHQAQKMEAIGRLTGGVAHDFNNILTAILGNCSLVLDDLNPIHPLRPDVEQILSAAQRAANLTHQLLAFSRQQVLQPRIVNLNEIVSNLEKMLRRLIGEHIALLTRLEEPLAPVKADVGQLEQVLLNLAVNARDAMPQGGQLVIETAHVELDQRYAQQHMNVPSGEYVMVAVSDSGVGMSPDVQARLFEPFFTTKPPGQGTGLGLATCYGIVRQHGGQIWVYSEPGHGTTVKVYLPRSTEMEQVGEVEEARMVGEPPSIMRNGQETVLLVEDEGPVRALAARVLRQLGYTVLEAKDGREALRVAGAHSGTIDLLLTDVVMPHLGGARLAEQLRERQPQLKVLFMSGYADQTLVHQSILEAGAAFLPKPFAPKLLARKVREVLVASAK